MADQFLADADRVLAESPVERRRGLDRGLGGRLAADDLDERDQVWRIERVADEHALRMGAGGLDRARRQAGGTRRQDDVGGRRSIEAAEGVALDVDPLGAVLLHEIRARYGILECRGESQTLARGAGRKPELLHHRPEIIDDFAQAGFGPGGWIGRGDIVAVGEKQRRPACPDDAGADHRDAPDRPLRHASSR
jgi:hypothetical protein